MIVKLPKLIHHVKLGNKSKKNEIIHLIEEEIEVNCEIEELQRTNFIITHAENRIFITSNKDNKPQEFDYIILCSKYRINEVESNITLKKWLKHPKDRPYNSSEIIESWKNSFSFKKEDTENNILGLRTPQIGAIHTLLGHLTNSKDKSTIVLPTGTGKTETMLSVLVAAQCKKLLVTVPSDSLRTQIANKFSNLGLLKIPDSNNNCILKPKAKYPIVGVLNTGFQNQEELEDFFNRCNVIISTMNLIINKKSFGINFQSKISEMCSHLFVDEAHHSKAEEWNKFINRFDKQKVVQFTATPYRNDGKLLDGKIIYNFTLKEAQEQGYFKRIDFLPIREYDRNEADKIIAETAIKKLRLDISSGYNHILMARCENQKRAEEIYNIYSEYKDLRSTLIHSGITGKRELKDRITNKEYDIIVCVDMLGEGFDLPELKIAAFHDIRKSLPITLQFAGRFTRTSRDSNLGRASFIANLHQPNINDELALLYAKESNWNSILPTLSNQATQEQIQLQEFLSGFQNIENPTIPYQDIKPAFSTVVYKNNTDSWHPLNFHNGIKGYENYDVKEYDINRDKKILIIFLGKKKSVDWGNFVDIYNIEWNIFIIYWEQKKNALFIHSSEKGSVFKELAQSIIGEDTVLIKDSNVFKSFHNVDRIRLYNVGLRKGLGKDISFQSYYGKGVQDALSESEEKSSVKNNVFGVGFENGSITSMGCSVKGRIWSYSRGTINEFKDWCDELAIKLFNPNIDPDKIMLKNTIKPSRINERPKVTPIATDWSPKLYRENVNVIFKIGQDEFDLSDSEINILNPDINNELKFSFNTINGEEVVFEQKLSSKVVNNETVYDFEIKNISNKNVQIKLGSSGFITLEEFFKTNPPIIWFADGTYLQGYEYVKFNEDVLLFEKENIESWDWDNVELNKESEGFENINPSSIQYSCFEKLFTEDFDILYNDDNTGEIADIVAIKDNENEVKINLYHLKYAIEGKVSNQIKNLYEVCGQAQKSLAWKYKEGKDFVNHLIKREFKKNKKNQTRLRKGEMKDLEALLGVVTRTKPVKYDIYIIQPAISKSRVSEDILKLLGATANHLKKQGNITLKVIGSE